MENRPQPNNQETPSGGIFPTNQQQVAQTQPPIAGDNSVLPNSSKKSKKKLLLAIILVLVLIVIVGGAIYILNQNKKASTPISKASNSAQVSKKVSVSTAADGLQTYVSDDKSNLIITNLEQKVLTKITNPAGSYGFFIYGNNSSTVLAAALTANGSNGQFYLISNSGKVTQVPSSISNNFNNKVGPGYLGNNNYIYTSCTGGTRGTLETCSIDNVSLSSGQSSTITSSTNSASTPSEDPTLSLAGVSPSSIAYIMSDGNGSENASLEEVNISSGATIKTVPLPKLQSPTNTTEYDRLSNDFNSIAYEVSDFIASQTINYEFAITNLNTGNTTTVDSQCDETPSNSSFIYNKTWSPDNNNIAFACQKSSTTFVGDLNVATDKVNILKSLPGSNTFTVVNWNTINVEGWSSDSTINFYYQIGQNTSSSAHYSINISTGTVSQPPTPVNYELLSPYTY
jgi:hypothetical protein